MKRLIRFALLAAATREGLFEMRDKAQKWLDDHPDYNKTFKTYKAWEAELNASGVPAGRVNEVPDALASQIIDQVFNCAEVLDVDDELTV